MDRDTGLSILQNVLFYLEELSMGFIYMGL